MAEVVVLLERYIQKEVSADLREKMVFISGPRQVGKITLAVNIGADGRGADISKESNLKFR